LNSLLFVGLLQMWRDQRHPVVALTAGLAVLKIAVEAASGQPLLTHTAWPSVPVVHAAGVLCGVVIAAAFRVANAAPGRRIGTRIDAGLRHEIIRKGKTGTFC
jgi:hypothetical protein